MINTQVRLAILGFGSQCSKKNAQIATTIGKMAGRNEISLVAGNVTSTFAFAFKASQEAKLANICVIEKHKSLAEKHDATEIYRTEDTYTKHSQIAQMSDAAILIGGGSGSQLLLNHFIKHNKTVIAIEGSGGIADKIKSKKVKKVKNPSEAFKLLFTTKQESYLKSHIGNIKLTYNHLALTRLDFESDDTEDLRANKNEPFVKQLLTYFKGKPTDFTGRIHLIGTEFQKRVWRAMLDIPYGKTMDFVEFSEFLGKENSEGAIGNIAVQNPIPIIIPSHRLITKRGQYHGDKETQMRLLDLENQQTELGLF